MSGKIPDDREPRLLSLGLPALDLSSSSQLLPMLEFPPPEPLRELPSRSMSPLLLMAPIDSAPDDESNGRRVKACTDQGSQATQATQAAATEGRIVKVSARPILERMDVDVAFFAHLAPGYLDALQIEQVQGGPHDGMWVAHDALAVMQQASEDAQLATAAFQRGVKHAQKEEAKKVALAKRIAKAAADQKLRVSMEENRKIMQENQRIVEENTRIAQQLEERQRETAEQAKLDEESPMCLLCFDAPRNMLMYPCTHVFYCQKCLEQDKLRNPEGQKCPLCSARIATTMAIHI